MRHLFLIHSAITYLVARATIRHETLNSTACAYVLLRGFQPDPDDPVSARLALADNVTVPLTWRVGAVWGGIANLDRQVATLLANEPFVLYVPHLDLPTARLLYTNRRCRQVSYLEEGTASYVAPPTPAFSVRDNVVRYLFSRGRYPAIAQFPDVHVHAYCIDAACFPGLARKVVLPLPFRRVTISPNPGGQVILVLDALIEFNLVAPNALKQALDALFAWLEAQGQRQILYKYHPVQAQSPERRAYYETTIFAPWRDRLHLTELTSPAPLEDVAFSYPTVEFAVISSSVGVYARFCGRRVVSVARRLMALDTRFAARMALMPPVFFESMEMI